MHFPKGGAFLRPPDSVPKPFDRLPKTLAEENPKLFLRYIGGVPIRPRDSIRAIPRELHPKTLAVDHAYEVRGANGRFISHFEFDSCYRARVNGRLAFYGGGLVMVYRISVYSTLILLSSRGVPKVVPEQVTIQYGGVEISATFRVVKLWEQDPKPLLKSGRRELLPWIPLMNATDAHVREAARRVVETGDRRLAADLVILARLRYDEDGLQAVLGRAKSMLLYKIAKETGLLDEVRQEGLQEGREEGREEGRLQQARSSVEQVLELRFPGVRSVAALRRISDVKRIERLFEALLRAPDEAAAKAALRRASGAL